MPRLGSMQRHRIVPGQNRHMPMLRWLPHGLHSDDTIDRPHRLHPPATPHSHGVTKNLATAAHGPARSLPPPFPPAWSTVSRSAWFAVREEDEPYLQLRSVPMYYQTTFLYSCLSCLLNTASATLSTWNFIAVCKLNSFLLLVSMLPCAS